MTERQNDKKQLESATKTFSVPIEFDLKEIQEDFSIITNTTSETYKEVKTNNAFKTHSRKYISDIELAKSFFRQSRYVETIDICKKILASEFNSIEAIKLLAKSFLETRELDYARLYLNKFLNFIPDDCEAIKDLGNTYLLGGDSKSAKEYYKQAIAINSSYAPALLNLGIVEFNINNNQEALSFFIKATEFDPELFPAWRNLSHAYIKLGYRKKAVITLRKAIELKPEFSWGHAKLGLILRSLGKLKEAEISMRKAIQFKSDDYLFYNNLALTLKDLHKFDEAILTLKKAIEINPDSSTAHSNLGGIYKDNGEFDKAEIFALKAIELNPNNFHAFFNLSLIELLKGNYESGLDNYEYRIKLSKYRKIVGNPILRRSINNKLRKGDKILIISEQSPGDIIFHMRYIKLLQRQGVEILFSAPKKLHSLIKDSNIHPDPFSPEQCRNLCQKEEWIPLMSLIKYFGVNPKNPIINTPYLSSSESLEKKWKAIISNKRKPLIGINWQGSRVLDLFSYPGRSLPLSKFSRIIEENDVNLLSFQKGFGSEQLEDCQFIDSFVSYQAQIDDIWDYSETAAIIKNCDLIITNDCSIGPLAAGLGKDVWLLLTKVPFWRWGLEGESTFWFPTMRLFRQKEFQDWDEVMGRVSKELKVFIKNKNINF